MLRHLTCCPTLENNLHGIWDTYTLQNWAGFNDSRLRVLIFLLFVGPGGPTETDTWPWCQMRPVCRPELTDT